MSSTSALHGAHGVAFGAIFSLVVVAGFRLARPSHSELSGTQHVLHTVARRLVSIPAESCQRRRPLADFRPMLDDIAVGTLVDEWSRPPMIQCPAGRLEVRSAGRDGHFDTADDLLVTREMN